MRTSALALWLLALLSGLPLGGCGDDDPAAPDAEVTVSFELDVQPVFNNQCTQCHNGSSGFGGLSLRPGESYGNLVSVDSAGYPGRLRVVPERPEDSVLYVKISGSDLGQRMPPTGALSDERVDTIRRWIAQGAANN